MVKVNINLIDKMVSIQDNLKTVKNMVKVYIIGRMGKVLKDVGIKEKETVKEF